MSYLFSSPSLNSVEDTTLLEKGGKEGKEDPSEGIRKLRDKLMGCSDGSKRSIPVARKCGGTTGVRALASGNVSGVEFGDSSRAQLHVEHGGGAIRMFRQSRQCRAAHPAVVEQQTHPQREGAESMGALGDGSSRVVSRTYLVVGG